MLGIVEHFLGSTHFHHLTAVKHSHTVSHIGDNTQVVGDEHNGVTKFLLQILDQLQDLRLNSNVQRSSRLVTNQDLRLTGQGDSDNNTLTHTAGVLEGIIVKTVFRIGNTHLTHHNHSATTGFALGAVLVLQDHGSDLLTNGNDGVQGGHGILEYGSDLAAADLGPVLGILDLSQVYKACAVQIGIIAVQVFHTEYDLVKHLISLLFIIQVHTQLHSLLKHLQQLVNELQALYQVITANRQINFLGNNQVAVALLLGNGLGNQLCILCAQLLHLGIVLLQIFRILSGSSFSGLNGSIALLFQILDLLIHFFKLGSSFLDLMLFLLGIQRLLGIKQLGTLKAQLRQSIRQCLVFFLAQTFLGLLFSLHSFHSLEDFSAILQSSVSVQGIASALDQALVQTLQVNLGIGQLRIIEHDAALINIAVAIQHTGKGLSKYRLTGAGLTNDGYRLILIEIQGDTADRT